MDSNLEPKTSFLVPPPCGLPANSWPLGIVDAFPPPVPYDVALVRPPVLDPEPMGTDERAPELLLPPDEPLPDEPPLLPPLLPPPRPPPPPPFRRTSCFLGVKNGTYIAVEYEARN